MRTLSGLSSGAAPYGLLRMPMLLGPTTNGFPPMISRTEAATAGSDSSVSITERSSPAWTFGVVQNVTKSIRSSGGRLRLSSVNVLSMPPPRRTPGNARRAARNTASAGGQGGQALPGGVLFRSAAGETAMAVTFRPACRTCSAALSLSFLKSSIDGMTSWSSTSAPSAAASFCTSPRSSELCRRWRQTSVATPASCSFATNGSAAAASAGVQPSAIAGIFPSASPSSMRTTSSALAGVVGRPSSFSVTDWRSGSPAARVYGHGRASGRT